MTKSVHWWSWSRDLYACGYNSVFWTKTVGTPRKYCGVGGFAYVYKMWTVC